ncbi:hypothetical protein NQ318_009303 [Aromia moschata]|uniref:DUF4817 domain-containing protein n=1 Tax=Aromia moschata TaxID=1265417 RepID=A0AAV8YIV0_9CUCU|nr:hypothetical protein NQ318_009303 [Aromia moschata]
MDGSFPGIAIYSWIIAARDYETLLSAIRNEIFVLQFREMVYLTEMQKITILQMVGYGDRTRTHAEVVRQFQEKYPELPPISQSTVFKAWL